MAGFTGEIKVWYFIVSYSAKKQCMEIVYQSYSYLLRNYKPNIHLHVPFCETSDTCSVCSMHPVPIASY